MEDAEADSIKLDKGVQMPYIRTHEYIMLTFAYNFGSVISLSTLQAVTLERPYVPTFI